MPQSLISTSSCRSLLAFHCVNAGNVHGKFGCISNSGKVLVLSIDTRTSHPSKIVLLSKSYLYIFQLYRMQTTVQSLDELAKQSRIRYTTTANSPYLEYFKNMAGAEDELYRKWKEITLNRSSDQSKYRVWDYPVKEQYTHILKMIEQTGPVASPDIGYQQVEAATNGTFAFIHDASEVRYQYYKNCNFLEVGEPFAEQPLAIAVQQGSHLQRELSRTILELQKNRFFETLTTKYWNTTVRNNCPVLDDSKGITIKSLGGIFLLTLAGLVLSMVTLAYEVWQQKKLDKSQVNHLDDLKQPAQIQAKKQDNVILVNNKRIVSANAIKFGDMETKDDIFYTGKYSE